jgi:hypothetical protein
MACNFLLPVLNPSPTEKVVLVLNMALCVEAERESSDSSCGNKLLMPKGIQSSCKGLYGCGSFGGSFDTSLEKEYPNILGLFFV